MHTHSLHVQPFPCDTPALYAHFGLSKPSLFQSSIFRSLFYYLTWFESYFRALSWPSSCSDFFISVFASISLSAFNRTLEPISDHFIAQFFILRPHLLRWMWCDVNHEEHVWRRKWCFLDTYMSLMEILKWWPWSTENKFSRDELLSNEI